MKTGLFVLGYPVLEYEGELFFGDDCYRQTIGCCLPHLQEIVVVARRLKIDKISEGYSRLSDVNATLGLELPDFGRGGLSGWQQAIKFIASGSLMRSLTVLAERADFIYADGPSFEAYLVAKAAKRAGKEIMFEMRGDVLLTRSYMLDRFGFAGLAYSWLARRTFDFTRKQAAAGLYINESHMRRYPVRGSCVAAITDVRITPELDCEPKRLDCPAANYLYVGYLGRVKRVDLILKALAGAAGNLPDNWNLTIVGWPGRGSTSKARKAA